MNYKNSNIYNPSWIIYLQLVGGLLISGLGVFIIYTKLLENLSIFIGFIFIIGGLLSVSIGLGVYFYLDHQQKQREYLFKNGAKVEARFNRFLKSKFKTSNQFKLIVECIYHDENHKKNIFKSNTLKNKLDFNTQTIFRVYYDPDDINIYFVDVDNYIQEGNNL